MDDAILRSSGDAKSAATRPAPLHQAIADRGFAFVPADELRPLLGRADAPADWIHFAESWNDLRLDTYLPDGHRYRYRRHATFSARAGECTCRLEPHRPHFQGIDYNPLVGGIDRWFEPIDADMAASQSLATILDFCCRLFGALRPDADWLIECHQFRIEARRDAPGRPTPEGVHRDGVDYVLVLLINRTNIESGTTTVHDLHGDLLGSFTLTTPLDAALVDDSRVKHGVT
ncbi:MAG: 2OG-Fe dioxygenase family protein, partial [Burkholderiaceae bacterium]